MPACLPGTRSCNTAVNNQLRSSVSSFRLQVPKTPHIAKPIEVKSLLRRQKEIDNLAGKNQYLHQRITTMKPSKELRRSAMEPDFANHLRFKATLRKLPVKIVEPKHY